MSAEAINLNANRSFALLLHIHLFLSAVNSSLLHTIIGRGTRFISLFTGTLFAATEIAGNIVAENLKQGFKGI
jgi:hypothetical protein